MAARILVVDDEPMVRALIARVLTDAGYEVVAVANGRAALDAARGAEVGSSSTTRMRAAMGLPLEEGFMGWDFTIILPEG